jgi:hypothetical protein
MKIDGRCHCGRISFEAEVDPASVTICHCADCQTLTGSAFRANIQTAAANFVLRSGTPKSYVKTAESGNKRRHAFCGDCGTPIYACAVEDPPSYSRRRRASRAETGPPFWLHPLRIPNAAPAVLWSSIRPLVIIPR